MEGNSNNTMWYVIGVVILILIAFGVWYTMGTSTPTSTSQQASATESGSTTGSQSQNTLKGLLSSGSSQKCTFTTSDNNTQSEGTIYVASGQMRGDFTSTADGRTTNSHMIVKDNTSYIWTDEMPQGFKMSFDAVEPQGNQSNQWLDPNASVNYNCSAWGVDASQFVLPTGIEFQDLSSMTIPTGVGR